MLHLTIIKTNVATREMMTKTSAICNALIFKDDAGFGGFRNCAHWEMI